MPFFLALLIWSLGVCIVTPLVQGMLLRTVPKSDRRSTPCVRFGIVFSLCRMVLTLLAFLYLLDLPHKDKIVIGFIVADVLVAAVLAWLTVHRYGSYARRSGFRTGINVGSLLFGIIYCIIIFF